MNKEAEAGSTQLVVTPAPHVKAPRTTQEIMFLVCGALLLPTIGGIIHFGIYSLFVVLVSVVTAVLTEYISKMLRKREFIMDGSAIITGMLFALVLPPRVPLWLVVIGSAFAIAIVKEAFGGLGHNIFNPALAGRAFVSVTFAGLMTKWIAPASSITAFDSTTTATPLSESFVNTGSDADLYWKLLIGDVGGSIGETSALLILIGGLILLYTRVIKWRIPTIYIGTVFLLTWIIGEDPIFHILAGGLFLGAFFMATDYVTIPLTDKGQYIFAGGAGILVVMIRLYGSMPEGVAYSILLMNAFTPLIDRYVRPTPYGYVPPEKPVEKPETPPESTPQPKDEGKKAPIEAKDTGEAGEKEGPPGESGEVEKKAEEAPKEQNEKISPVEGGGES
jgi:Na+-translocating ferredoxin:NAD+ oxidoreductase subunit D